ncbi:integrase domain-containing protein [Domibacillus tundrae]|uniref:integrase domain-containing protein n=1 Tax=Domibacillus tundrae TaxID=1587527 RepID=UPI003399FCD1
MSSMGFVKWAQAEHGVKRLNHVKEHHVRAYIEFKKSEGCGAGHLRSIQLSLKHLQNGSEAYFSRFDRKIEAFVPKEYLANWKDVKAPENRSYKDKDFGAVKNGVSVNVAKTVDLMRGLGLRSSEALSVRKEHFQKDENGWKLVIGRGEGITKGGRPREVPVRKSFEPTLEREK